MSLGNNLKVNNNSDYLNGNHAASNQLKDFKLHNNNSNNDNDNDNSKHIYV